MLSLPGRRKTILLCDDCNRKVKEDQPTLSRVMAILNGVTTAERGPIALASTVSRPTGPQRPR
jgi:hypothetical protein